MEIIQPSDITAKILSIIDEANENIVLVSPAFGFYKWDAFLKRMQSAKKRSVRASFWTKEPLNKKEQISIQEVETIGYTPRLIPHLNTCLYFNEHTAIIGSKPLSFEAVETHGLDFAFKTENPLEYAQIMGFYEKFIKVDGANLVYDTNAFLEDLDNGLLSLFPKNIRIQYDGKMIMINAKGRYRISIVQEKYNYLKLNCILTAEEMEHLKRTRMELLNKGKLLMELEEGEDQYHQFIWGTLPGIKTSSLDKILDSEAVELKNTIVNFIAAIKEMKDYVASGKA